MVSDWADLGSRAAETRGKLSVSFGTEGLAAAWEEDVEDVDDWDAAPNEILLGERLLGGSGSVSETVQLRDFVSYVGADSYQHADPKETP